MRTNYFSLKGFSVALALSMQFFTAKAQQTFIDTYTFTGSVQTFTVPSCVSTVSIEVWGAEGGYGYFSGGLAGAGGLGGYAAGTRTVNQGDVLYIYVGGAGVNGGVGIGGTGGFNGGGLGGSYSPTSLLYGGGGGGGASDVRLNGNTFSDRIIVGAGGGGGSSYALATGGAGGGLTGANGLSTSSGVLGTKSGYGGTQTAGGAGGTDTQAGSAVGSAGTFGLGGNSGVAGCSGGGGGGWYGGGGGSGCNGGGGGGGSSYYGGMTGNTTTTPGIRSGNGQVKISYNYSGAGVTVVPSSTLICIGQSISMAAGSVVSYTWLPVGTFGGSNSTIINDTPLSTTAYTVEGTNSIGCISSSVITVYVSDPQVNVTVSHPVICAGQSSTLTASGASSYNWVAQSGGFSDINSGTLVVNSNTMPSGVYDVSGTDTASCVAPLQTVTVTVLAPNAAISGANEVCKGNTITLTASGADSYTWNTNSNATSIDVSPLINTTYTLNGSISQDNVTCYNSTTHSVTAHNSPGVTALSNRNVICKGESVVLNAIGSGATSYTWTNGTTNTLSSTWKVSPQSTQDYTITVSNQFNCTANYTIQVKVEQCTGLSENTKNTGVSVYPNPNKGEFVITAEHTMELQIINEVGQVVKTVNVNKETTKVKLDDLSSGIYFIIGKNQNGTVKEKIVIEK